MIYFKDPVVCLVEVSANEALAEIALRAFERLGAFQVPETQIVALGQGSSKSFILTLYVDNDQIAKQIQKLGFVKRIYQNVELP